MPVFTIVFNHNSGYGSSIEKPASQHNFVVVTSMFTLLKNYFASQIKNFTRALIFYGIPYTLSIVAYAFLKSSSDICSTNNSCLKHKLSGGVSNLLLKNFPPREKPFKMSSFRVFQELDYGINAVFYRKRPTCLQEECLADSEGKFVVS
jgi:hypothetical protein